jgi:hypothetical protein
MAKNIVEIPKLFSYQMPQTMVDNLIDKKDKGKVDIQSILVDWVNKNCGLMYPVDKVIITEK